MNWMEQIQDSFSPMASTDLKDRDDYYIEVGGKLKISMVLCHGWILPTF